MNSLKPLPVVITPRIIVVEDSESALPLEHTLVSAQISGPVAAVVVTQRFGNPLKEPAELEYLYPLPEEAAITGFMLRIGARRIQGSLQELEAARAAYDTARESGKRAGLLEQHRPNLFGLRLANVRPGETIHAELRYQQRLKFVDDAQGGAYEFVYPMGLTPKYDSPEYPGEAEGVNAPIARGEKIGPVEINLSADTGFAIRETISPSHAIEVVQVDERRVQVRLSGEQIPDHDFVLRLGRAEGGSLATAWTSGEAGSATFLAALIPPVLEGDPQPPPREYIFILDRSGSMSGPPIRQARNALRACLRALNDGDSFAILLFDNQLEWIQQEPVPVTQTNIDAADAFLDRVEGRGGTEIVRALESVLALAGDPRRGRVIVFLTDGAVSAEARLLEKLRGNIGTARLFTFGIGPSVNRALLSRMAALGRGRTQFLQLDEDIEGAIIRFQDSISFPALTDLSLFWQKGEGLDIYPVRLPDLYYGQPLEICGRVKMRGSGPARLTLRGMREGQPVELAVDLPQPSVHDPALERIWARASVDDLFEQMTLEPGSTEKLRSQIIELALEYSLVTALTAFVAVDESDETSGGTPRLIRVAQPLPAGLEPGGFGPTRQVMTAGMMPANMLSMAKHIPTPNSLADDASYAAGAAPAFFMRRSIQDAEVKQPETGQPVGADRSVIERGKAQAAESTAQDPQSLLRWLARTQNLDGSWAGVGNLAMERTAAALLAFVRAGHTSRAGSYRQAVRRSARWLAANSGDSWASLARAHALEALAHATGDPADRETADTARQQVPRSSAVMDISAPVPDPLVTLDDLRLAGITGAHRRVPETLLRGSQAELALTWAAALTEQSGSTSG